MPNRIVRDGWLDSDRIAKVTHGAEALFLRLILVADDFGRFDGRVTVIRARCWPLKPEVSDGDVEGWLQELEAAGLIVRYTVNLRPYVEIPNFRQRTRAQKSKFPGLEQAEGGIPAAPSVSAPSPSPSPNSVSVSVRGQPSQDGHPSGNGQAQDGHTSVQRRTNDGHSTDKRRRIGFDFEKGEFTGITNDDELRWQSAFPDVQVPVEIDKAAAWIKANNTRAPRAHFERFLVAWFAREQRAITNRLAAQSQRQAAMGAR